MSKRFTGSLPRSHSTWSRSDGTAGPCPAGIRACPPSPTQPFILSPSERHSQQEVGCPTLWQSFPQSAQCLSLLSGLTAAPVRAAVELIPVHLLVACLRGLSSSLCCFPIRVAGLWRCCCLMILLAQDSSMSSV